MSEDYCDLCDLPLSTCVHGMPPAPMVEPPAPTPRATRSTSTRTTTPRAKAPKKAAAEVPVRRAPRRWTPPEFFAPHVLALLQEAGGELGNDALFEALEARVADDLIAGDHESTPEGELRWRRAARVARRNLSADGLMQTGTPGVWVLTGEGLSHDGDFSL
ncbi:MAG: hypothetical protein ACI379_11105 [Nocardioides sp.]|uniref:hypothetical protein n=1 Tax=Nocardioides sp. TaxID=35761 RepID=UPI003F0DA40C